MSGNLASIIKQLVAQKAAYGVSYGPGGFDLGFTIALAQQMDMAGVTDLKSIARYDGPSKELFHNGRPFNTSYYYDKRTGQKFEALGQIYRFDTRGGGYPYYDESQFPDRLFDAFTGFTLVTDMQIGWGINLPVDKYHGTISAKDRGKGEFVWEVNDIQLTFPGSMLSTVLPVFLGLVTFAIPGIGAAIGSTILGSTTAAAYPALTAAVGNVVVSTVVSGGDIEAAVKGQLLSFVGGQVGGFVGSNVSAVTGSELIGKSAAAVTSSIVRGGDPLFAVAGAVLPDAFEIVSDMVTAPPVIEPAPTPAPAPVAPPSSGGSMDFDFEYDWGGSVVDYPALPDDSYNWGFDWDFGGGYTDPIYSDPGAGYFDPVYDAPISDDPSAGYFDPVYDWSGNDPSAGYFDPVYDPPVTTDPGADYFDPVYDAPPTYDPSAGYFDPVYDVPPDMVDTGIFPHYHDPSGGQGSATSPVAIQETSQWLNTAAQIALMGLKAWQQAGQPKPQLPGIRQTPTGQIVTPNKNGTVTITNPNGTKQTIKMPVGQPQVFADGTAVVNNGDGTYSTVGIGGQASIKPYTQQSGLGSLFGGDLTMPLAIGAGGLILVALLARGRR